MQEKVNRLIHLYLSLTNQINSKCFFLSSNTLGTLCSYVGIKLSAGCTVICLLSAVSCWLSKTSLKGNCTC